MVINDNQLNPKIQPPLEKELMKIPKIYDPQYCPPIVLNPTQRNSSILGANLWVAETTNKSSDTTKKSAPLSMKSIQIPVLHKKPDRDLDHPQVGT